MKNALCSVTTGLYKSLTESVNKFIVYKKFVTGLSSTQQSLLWKRAMHCEQRLSRPNRTITGLALLQLCLKVYLREGCSFSTHSCNLHRKYIPCLASNKTRQCIFLNVYPRLFTCDTFHYDE